MKTKTLKRSYSIPEGLIRKWAEFHRPSKDYSPSVAGAMVAWMALPAELREAARRGACGSNVDKAVDNIGFQMAQTFRKRK